jgi:beta-mannanase
MKSELFPFNKAKAIYDLGSMPMITWEPWLNDFTAEEYPGIPDVSVRDAGCLAAIASGFYDPYIDEWAAQVKRFGSTIIIRLAHEMNDPYRYPWGPQNNKNTDFVDAWKHVHDRFRNAGANNVQWMWSPHPAYYNYGEYYPGDSYVDWVGVPALNYGTIAPWSNWWSFDEIFGNYYKYLAMFKKPIMVTEFASLNTGGNRSKWYKDALHSFKKYPLLKSVIFFHSGNDNTTTYKSLNWQIVNDKAVMKSLSAEMK